jgi:sarcosine oxidase subunit alpha
LRLKQGEERLALKPREIDIGIIGGGPAGLCAALVASYLLKEQAKIVLIDENPRLGGQLIKQTHMFFGSKMHYCGTRGIDIARIFEKKIKETGVELLLNATVLGCYEDKIISVLQNKRSFLLKSNKIIIATGAFENMLAFVGNDLPGVYGAGAVQTLMNVHGIRPGRRVLMIGSGNIGLIVSYQLLQAGVEVKGIVEAMPHIGGYLIHAAKIRRCGVPIYVSHSIKEAVGVEEVEGAIIAKLDQDWKFIDGTERYIEVDTICLAVGLSPLIDILRLLDCEIRYISELGGYVPIHTEDMVTTNPDVLVAGDVSGIEEACTAMLEGRIAGAEAALSLNPEVKEEALKIKEKAKQQLDIFRQGPFGEKAKIGKQKVYQLISNKSSS